MVWMPSEWAVIEAVAVPYREALTGETDLPAFQPARSGLARNPSQVALLARERRPRSGLHLNWVRGLACTAMTSWIVAEPMIPPRCVSMPAVTFWTSSQTAPCPGSSPRPVSVHVVPHRPFRWGGFRAGRSRPPSDPATLAWRSFTQHAEGPDHGVRGRHDVRIQVNWARILPWLKPETSRALLVHRRTNRRATYEAILERPGDAIDSRALACHHLAPTNGWRRVTEGPLRIALGLFQPGVVVLHGAHLGSLRTWLGDGCAGHP